MTNLTAGASTGNFNIGALISGAFSVLHGALPSFLALAVIPVVPTVLSLIFVGTPTAGDEGAYLKATGVFTLGSVILSLMIQGAMVYGAFNQMRGRPFSVAESLSKGFVRANVMSYPDFLKAGYEEKHCKTAGTLRQESKEYVVQDGDIMHILAST